MMKITSKVSLFLVIILAMIVSIPTYAAEPDKVKVKDGTLTWLFTESESFEIPSTVNTIESIGATHALRAVNLKNLVIPSNVTIIKGGAFQGDSTRFPNLETVKVPDTVKTIQMLTFANNKKLKTVELGDGTTEILENAFENAEALGEIKLPEGLTILGQEAFENTGLTKVEVPGTVKVISIGTFRDNLKLTEVKLNEGTVEIKDEAFGGNRSMTSLYLPKSVTKIASNVFNNASQSSTSQLTIFAYKGSYAETFAKEKGIKCVILDVPTSINLPVKPEGPPSINLPLKPQGPTSTNLPPVKQGLDITYSQPLKTLKKTVKFNPENYGMDKRLWKNGNYDVQVWKKGMEMKFSYFIPKTKVFDYEAGFLIEKNGKLDFFKGEISDTFVREDAGYTFDEFGRDWYSVLAPKALTFTDVDGKKYNESSKEIYGYVRYRFLTHEDMKTYNYNADKFYDYEHLVLVKLDYRK